MGPLQLPSETAGPSQEGICWGKGGSPPAPFGHSFTPPALPAGHPDGHLHGRLPALPAEHLWRHPLPPPHLGGGHLGHHGVLLHGHPLLLLRESPSGRGCLAGQGRVWPDGILLTQPLNKSFVARPEKRLPSAPTGPYGSQPCGGVPKLDPEGQPGLGAPAWMDKGARKLMANLPSLPSHPSVPAPPKRAPSPLGSRQQPAKPSCPIQGPRCKSQWRPSDPHTPAALSLPSAHGVKPTDEGPLRRWGGRCLGASWLWGSCPAKAGLPWALGDDCPGGFRAPSMKPVREPCGCRRG